jgi:hypothetical protein
MTENAALISALENARARTLLAICRFPSDRLPPFRNKRRMRKRVWSFSARLRRYRTQAGAVTAARPMAAAT